jgi:hypothetical protein
MTFLSLSPIKWHTNERNGGTAYALRENLTRCREYLVLLRIYKFMLIEIFPPIMGSTASIHPRDLRKYLGCPRDVQIGWRSRIFPNHLVLPILGDNYTHWSFIQRKSQHALGWCKIRSAVKHTRTCSIARYRWLSQWELATWLNDFSVVYLQTR